MNVVEYMEAVIAERDTLREREDYVWQVLAEAGIKREDCAAVPGAPVQVPGWGVLSLRAERDDLRAQLAKVTKERDAQRRELDRIADSREVEGDGMHGPGEWERLRSERDALAAEKATWLHEFGRQNEKRAEAEEELDRARRHRDEYRDEYRADYEKILASRKEVIARLATLESTADDARMVADYVIDAPYALSKYADAARRILGQLPPRPVKP